jgi:hypothetical protein
VVISRITPDGLKLVEAIDKPLARLLKRHMGRVGPKKLAHLIEILESLRED